VRVNRNKRDFVLDILPVVDMFKNAPFEHPADTEREKNMHTTFGTLISSITNVFEKYGVKELVTEEGDTLNSINHQVDSVVLGEKDGVIVEVLKQGFVDQNGVIIRRALVVVSKTKIDEEEPADADESVKIPEGEEEEEESEDAAEE